MELLRDLAQRDGVTVLAVLHDIALARHFFDRLLLLDDGRLVADGQPAEVLTPDRIRDVYGVDPASSLARAAQRQRCRTGFRPDLSRARRYVARPFDRGRQAARHPLEQRADVDRRRLVDEVDRVGVIGGSGSSVSGATPSLMSGAGPGHDRPARCPRRAERAR